MARRPDTHRNYDSKPLAQALQRLMAERGLNHRQAALQAGLDREAIYRFVDRGQRPSRDGVIALADSMGANPNDLLVLAGYKPMAIFQATPAGVPPDMRGLIARLQAIGDPVVRSRVIGALELLLETCYPAPVEQKALSDSTPPDGAPSDGAA